VVTSLKTLLSSDFQENNLIDVYFSLIPKSCEIKTVFPKERDEEIQSVNNAEVKKEKYCVWRLLEYALLKSLGIKLCEAGLFKDKSGKWHSSECEFSITHSGSLAAVAISHAPVGIDVEPKDKAVSEGFAKRFLTPDELSLYSSVPSSEKNEFLLTRWCIKEAVFKKSGGEVFAPSSVSTVNVKASVKRVCVENKEYVLALSGDGESRVSFYEVPYSDLFI